MNERELIARAKTGDFSAFSALIERNKARIYGLARKLAGNDQDAEDIMQETFLKAIDKIDQFRGDSAFGTWLYSIALNEGRSLLAKQRLSELKPIEAYLPSKGSEPHADISDRLFDWEDPHKLLEQEELRTIIDTAIGELPYKYRAAFLLRYAEELSVKEVADLIGESVAATKSRILRARLALRDSLSSAFKDSYAKKM